MPSRVGTAVAENMTSSCVGDGTGRGDGPFSEETFDPGEDTREGVESTVDVGAGTWNTGVVLAPSLLLLLGRPSREVELSFHLLISSVFCNEHSRSYLAIFSLS